MTDLNGKNVLITGAASGIGRLMALKIAALGGRLILWDVNREALAELCGELNGRGLVAQAYPCDLADRSAIATAAIKVLEEFGSVDVLINNAGVVFGKWLLDASDEEILRTFNVNTMALFWMARAFLPAMLDHNSGHIVTIPGAAGFAGVPRLTDYVASKFAAFGFNEALRLDLRRRGVNICTTVVCPYYIGTGMFAGVKTRFPWLLPILEPEYVADRIIWAIRNNRRRLIMPRFVLLALGLRWLPPTWFDRLMDFFGVNKSMDEFSGRPPH